MIDKILYSFFGALDKAFTSIDKLVEMMYKTKKKKKK